MSMLWIYPQLATPVRGFLWMFCDYAKIWPQRFAKTKTAHPARNRDRSASQTPLQPLRGGHDWRGAVNLFYR